MSTMTTKNRPTQAHDDAKDSLVSSEGNPPSIDEQVARHLLDRHGERIIDAYREKIDALDAAMARDSADPWTGPGRMAAWLRTRREDRRQRHELARRLGLLEALLDGLEAPPGLDDAELDRRAGADLLALYTRN